MVLRAAVVGTGFGGRVHVPALRAAGFDVVALVGRDGERTQRRSERLGIEHACADLASAFAFGIDAVTIASPPHVHAEHALAAIRAGARVLCEKPFALDGDEAQSMLDAARSAGVTHLVGHEFRWSPDRAAVHAAIAAGRIGTPRLLCITHAVELVAAASARMPAWWFDAAQGGGWLGASGSHVIDQVRCWLDDEFVTVSATLPMVSARDPRTHAEDSFSLRATTARGVEVVLVQTASGRGSPGGSTFVSGTDGTVWIDAGGAWLGDADGTHRLDGPVLPQLPDVDLDDPRHRYSQLELGPYIRLCEVLAGGGTPLGDGVAVPTFADGVAEMRVIDAIRASAAAGGAVVAVAR